MDGRRKVKMAGVAQIILLNRAEIWIINIKQDSAGQPIQEIINEAEHQQDHQIHVLHQVARRQGPQDLAEVVVEEEVEEEDEVVEAGGRSK